MVPLVNRHHHCRSRPCEEKGTFLSSNANYASRVSLPLQPSRSYRHVDILCYIPSIPHHKSRSAWPNARKAFGFIFL
jgi:hypothetical protein